MPPKCLSVARSGTLLFEDLPACLGHPFGHLRHREVALKNGLSRDSPTARGEQALGRPARNDHVLGPADQGIRPTRSADCPG